MGTWTTQTKSNKTPLLIPPFRDTTNINILVCFLTDFLKYQYLTDAISNHILMSSCMFFSFMSVFHTYILWMQNIKKSKSNSKTNKSSLDSFLKKFLIFYLSVYVVVLLQLSQLSPSCPPPPHTTPTATVSPHPVLRVHGVFIPAPEQTLGLFPPLPQPPIL